MLRGDPVGEQQLEDLDPILDGPIAEYVGGRGQEQIDGRDSERRIRGFGENVLDSPDIRQTSGCDEVESRADPAADVVVHVPSPGTV